MADYNRIYATTYKPGDAVEASGVYRVTHPPKHASEHEITVIYGRQFPPCNGRGQHPRFKAVKLAQHIDANDHFKRP